MQFHVSLLFPPLFHSVLPRPLVESDSELVHHGSSIPAPSLAVSNRLVQRALDGELVHVECDELSVDLLYFLQVVLISRSRFWPVLLKPG